MTDRDMFAAAALTGLLAGRKFTDLNDAIVAETYAEVSFGLADAMLAVRGSRTADKTTHDAAPAAKASVESVAPQPTTLGDSARTDKAAPRPSDGTGDTPIAKSATPDGYAYTGWPYQKGKAASVSDAEIDAIQHVVEDRRFGLVDYGHLRSLLVRLRPEWEQEHDEPDRSQPVKDAESDRSKPISDERLAALDELSAFDQELEAIHGLQGNPMIKARHNNESI